MMTGSSRGCLAGADFLPAPRPLVRGEDFLPQANRFRRDLDEFVVGDEFDGLFEAQLAMRDQADGLIGGRRGHVWWVLFSFDVYVPFLLARGFSHDHGFIDFP